VTGVTADLAPVHDVVTTLDADVADVTSYTTGTVGTVSTVHVPVGDAGVLGVTDTVTHQLGQTTDLVSGLDVPGLGHGLLSTHNLPVVGSLGVDSVLDNPTGHIGDTLHGVGVGNVVGGLGGHADANADAHADTHGGLLGGATDILF
jgi:hypothetical protein